ncbi:hypothetical protein AWC27_06130 [Mycobacterium szulgai]|uniref:Uncharacterized protein n=2 Tax=Mycobacterium szulgai TaxID=1787 RepID=A0A1X2E6B5_MYCSZ|nr:hypothetical protein [Mycobacterium szulgai]ORW95996.1 hypothetical protein AWC27_06130 [Mycobacterium szulgai]
MSSRWHALIGDLSGGTSPSLLGLSCQASSAAVRAANADIAAFKTALVVQARARALEVAEADSRYVRNELSAADELATVVVGDA